MAKNKVAPLFRTRCILHWQEVHNTCKVLCTRENQSQTLEHDTSQLMVNILTYNA